MKTVRIVHQTRLTLDQARSALERVFANLSTQYGLTGWWSSPNVFYLQGPNITGTVSMNNRGLVEITLQLGAILIMFAKKIEKEIKSQLKQQFG